MFVTTIPAEETYQIRLDVLRKGIDLPAQFSGDFDEDTFHLGVFENNVLVGVSSFMKTENKHFKSKQFQLRGMAMLEKFRGKGLGKLMIGKALSVLRDREIDVLWCNAREAALQFYVKQGFLIQGSMFEINKIGNHYMLFKNI
ncbi:MAG: GNAT family N-acetyltransferase [Polaribacter sp.]|nr:GNAT family N-acetyltransferase [Polaribacter sp.]MDG1993601.1 GNAT family N-acetyltransferase [Polaribacter sp.]